MREARIKFRTVERAVLALAATSLVLVVLACVRERRYKDADVCAASAGFDLALKAERDKGTRGPVKEYLAVNPSLSQSIRGTDEMLQKPLEPPAGFLTRLSKVRAGVEPVSAMSASSPRRPRSVVVVVGSQAVQPDGLVSVAVRWHAGRAGIWVGEFMLSSTPRGWKVERVVEWGSGPPPLPVL